MMREEVLSPRPRFHLRVPSGGPVFCEGPGGAAANPRLQERANKVGLRFYLPIKLGRRMANAKSTLHNGPIGS